MTRFWRNSLLTVVAMLCLGLIVSGTGLKLPAFSRGEGAIAQEQRAPVAAIDSGDREILPTARGDREGLIETDRSWYEPGEVIVVTGSGFDVGEVVTLVLHEEPTIHKDKKVSIVADAFGNIFDNQFVREGAEKGITFYLTARGESSGLTTQRVLASPSADLDQWANLNNAWVNGNLGSSKARYFEGDSIPYRLKFGSLSTSGTHTVTIEWDTLKGGKHALDYITTFNRSVPHSNPTIPGETAIDPCAGVSGCSATYDSEPILPAPNGPASQGSGNEFRLYGGDITGLSSYTVGTSADGPTKITITFTASVANPVLTWGGHIATRLDWGLTNSAVSISGSPYHTRLLDLDGSGGNQDRSLSSDATIFPGKITITKQATPEGNQSFPFTATPSPLSSFSLVDDGSTSNVKVFDLLADADFKTYTITESAVTNWQFDGVVCTVASANGGSTSISGNAVTISLKEGESRSCIFSNSAVAPKLTLIKSVTNDNGGNAGVNDFGLTIGGNATTSGTKVTLNANQAYAINEAGLTGYSFVSITGSAKCPSALGGTVTLAFGDDISCTITNDDVAPKLTLIKSVTNDNGGNAGVNDFGLTIGGNATTSGTKVTLNANQAYAINEAGLTGYSFVSITGNAKCPSALGGTVTLDEGDDISCTITNDDGKASPTIATDMSWTLADKAVFTGVVTNAAICNAPSAPVTFNLYGPFNPLSFDDSASSNCSGTPVFTSSAMSIADAAATGASHPVTAPGIYVWQVVYLGDDCNNGRTTACNSEITEVKEANSIPTP